MSEAKHTPGEWVPIPPAREGKHWKVGVKGTLGGGTAVAVASVTWFVAQVHNGAPGDTLETEGANARLIAAAPDLLGVADDALAFVRHTLEFFGWGQFPNLQESVEQLRDKLTAAIAKARGGAT